MPTYVNAHFSCRCCVVCLLLSRELAGFTISFDADARGFLGFSLHFLVYFLCTKGGHLQLDVLAETLS